ncbi:hypothetical protein [Azorhizophilus paspali]|uniref:Uncharacterized protein n=1 Tax=Azorhizophilus paspali TaxID=69963 RepID=A0ABV6SNU5_AZOPA
MAAMATASPATRMVVKMPAAIPASSLGTTLTDKASIKPHGRPLPMPISNMGIAIAHKLPSGDRPINS